LKLNILLFFSSDDEHPVVISDSEDESSQASNADSRSVGIGANTMTKPLPETRNESNPSSPVKAVLTNVTTIPQSLFDNFSSPSHSVSTTSLVDLEKKSNDVEDMETDGTETGQTSVANQSTFSLSDFEDMPDCTENDRVQALKLITEIEEKMVDFRKGPPLDRYTFRQISMAGEMLKKRKTDFRPASGEAGMKDDSVVEGAAKGDSVVEGDTKGDCVIEGDTKGDCVVGGDSIGDADGVVEDVGTLCSRSEGASAEVAQNLEKEKERTVLANGSTSADDDQSKEVSIGVEVERSSKSVSDDQIAPSGDEPDESVEKDIVSESLDVVKKLVEEQVLDFDDNVEKVDNVGEGEKSDEDAETSSDERRKRKHSGNEEGEDRETDKKPRLEESN
jgi:hypothetical protein